MHALKAARRRGRAEVLCPHTGHLTLQSGGKYLAYFAIADHAQAIELHTNASRDLLGRFVVHGLSPVMEWGLGLFASMKESWFFCDGDLRLFVISILNNSSPPVQMLTNGATHSAGAVDVAGT
jgi:hypothetical protein